MPKVVREDVDNLNAVITVTIEKSDYEARLRSELEKYRRQTNMKGFRKGKTPISLVKKMYGKPVLAEVVNDLLQKELVKFLTDEDLSLLGQPIPSEDQKDLDFDIKDLDDFEFKFDLGLAPDFEVEGLSDENTFEKYKVLIPEERVEQELEAARRRLGERVFPEEDIQDNDIVKMSAKELEGDAVKEDGVESTFSILVSSIDHEAAKNEILSKKLGDTLRLNLFDLEKEKDDQYVRRYFLELDEEDDRDVGKMFEVTIEEVSRVKLADLDQEFFNKFFGEEEVSNEEEAKLKIREEIQKQYFDQAESLMYRDIREDFIGKNQQALPNDFLKRWLKASNEEVSAETIEEEYENFTKNLHWSLIRSKLAKRFELKVETEEVKEVFKDRIRGYFGYSQDVNDDLLENMVGRFIEDQDQYQQVYDTLMNDKVFEAIEAHVTVQTKDISIEDFEGVLKKLREEADAAERARAARQEEE